MRVLFVTSEIATLYKRGGLADVSYALPVALSNLGINVSIAIPFYEKIRLKDAVCIGQLAIDYDRRRELMFIFRALLPHSHVRVYLFRHPLLNEYDGPHIAARFAFFSKAVAQLYLYSGATLGGPYDVIHCNDWHTGLVPMLLGEHKKVAFRERETIQSERVKTVYTIHNLLYQGETSSALALKLGLPKSVFHAFTTPLGRAIRLLAEGMEYSDAVTTVSPTYAKEIMRGVHGKRVVDIFKRRGDKIIGLLNGLDTRLWDPRHDAALPIQYSLGSVDTGKATVKKLLQKALKLPVADVPLFGFVGRLEGRQKGLDLVARAIERLDDSDYQMVILGTGQKKIVTNFNKLTQKHHNVVFVHTFDERLARRIYAGSDLMLVPSRFEPCGLTQMIAMRYGTLPIVRKTGGLADTVTDGKTGFVFGPYTTSALVAKMEEAISLYRQQREYFRAMSRAVMKEDFSWQHQVLEYAALYRKLLTAP